jgi:hypothetical protein
MMFLSVGRLKNSIAVNRFIIRNRSQPASTAYGLAAGRAFLRKIFEFFGSW